MRRQPAAPILAALMLALAVVAAPVQAQPAGAGQVPQGQAQGTTAQPTAQPPQPAAPPASEQVPTAETLGVPFYPSMAFLGSFDAGSGQRYYLFGVNDTFNEVVSWYKAALKQRGELVFDEPATQEFDIGKFREDTMAFPPSVTVKDYAWGGMTGYPNPNPKGEPARFRIVIQIVPAPSPAPIKH